MWRFNSRHVLNLMAFIKIWKVAYIFLHNWFLYQNQWPISFSSHNTNNRNNSQLPNSFHAILIEKDGEEEKLFLSLIVYILASWRMTYQFVWIHYTILLRIWRYTRFAHSPLLRILKLKRHIRPKVRNQKR